MTLERADVTRSAGVHRAVPRWLTVVLGLAGTALAVLGMRAASSVLAPILLALVLTVAVHPLLAGLERRGMPRWLAVTVAVLVVDGALIALVVSVAVSLGRLATELPTYAAQWDQLLQGLRHGLVALGVGPEQVQTALRSVGPGAVVGAVTGLLGGLLSATTELVFVLATVLFMCADASTLPARVAASGAERTLLGPALAAFARSTRSYIVVTTVFGFIVAVLDTIALAVLGIPLALLWGLLSFVTNYVPNVGFVIGLLPPTLLALLVDGPRSAILVVVIYSVINLVLQSVVQPAFVGDAVGLSVTVTFLSLVVWAWVLGPLGAILSVPLTLLFRAVLLEADPEAAWARALVAHGDGSAGPTARRRGRRASTAPTPAEPAAAAAVPDPADGVGTVTRIPPSSESSSAGNAADPDPAGRPT